MPGDSPKIILKNIWFRMVKIVEEKYTNATQQMQMIAYDQTPGGSNGFIFFQLTSEFSDPL